MKKYFYFFYLLLPLIHFFSLVDAKYIFSVPVFVFVMIPMLDFIFGEKKEIMIETNDGEDSFYHYVMYFYIPIHIFLVLFGAHYISNQNLSVLQQWVFTISTGLITGGIGITIAHELCHRKNSRDQLLSDILLSFVCYTHFSTEHVLGHHKRVATEDDPATARFGESIYHFLFRSVKGSFLSALNIEKIRLKKNDKKVWSLENRILRGVVFQIAICLVLTVFWGSNALRFFIIQSIVAFTLLELVNYVEHYGLERKKIDGRYSKILPKHSWNNSNLISNLILFNLQRHSHHHADASVEFQHLKHYEEAPQLPLGYPSMVLLALFPPLWKKYMDPMVLKFNSQKA